MRMDVTFNPMPPPAAATHMAPGSAPNSTIHSPARTTPSTPYFYSSSAPSSPTYRRVRTMDDGYPPAIRTDADLFGVRRERSDSAPLPRYNGSLRRRQSFSNSSPHSPQRGNEDSSESVSSESSTSGSPNPTKPPSAPRKRKENHGGEIGGPPKRRGRKPNVSKLVRDFLPNHSKVLNGVDQLNSNINDFQKLRSDASETAGAPMVTWKGELPMECERGH